jgi:hypothetical protein
LAPARSSEPNHPITGAWEQPQDPGTDRVVDYRRSDGAIRGTHEPYARTRARARPPQGGAETSTADIVVVGDLERHRRAIRVRWTFEKNERYRHLELPDDLFDALLATLPPREDRDLRAPLFPNLTDARLRMAINRACKATGTPHFSPHGLRRRRGSLHYKRTGSLAEVAELLGDSKRVAADHYVYALTSYEEAHRTKSLARLRT